MRLLCGSALLLAIVASSAAAQTIHGVVRDSASREPIAGAVVMLLDSSGAVLGRTMTDEGGRYRVANSERARSLRVVRIGFQPRVTSVPGASDRTAPIDLGMLPFVTTLAAVKVTDKSRCPRRSDAAAAEALWEQARAGLLATVVARETNPATLHRLVFERVMDGASDRVTRFLVAGDSISGVARPFKAAASAAGFVEFGFKKDSAGKRIVYGPDAEVLLDDAFADAYCFRVAEATRARAGQVGLAFRAPEHPPARVDIDGTLWIDTAARVLRDIEFRYVGLPGYTDAFLPGGSISFREMAQGVVLIDRWNIRNVAVATDTVHDLSILEGDDRRLRNRFFAVENGGEVASATWPDGKAWRDALGAIQLHVVTNRGRPAAGTIVALSGTPYRGTADSSGNVVITDLLPGPYAAEVLEPRLARLAVSIPTSLKFVAVRDSTLHSTMTIPTAEEYAKNRCAAAANRFAPGDSVFILGRAARSDGTSIADATVTAAIRLKTGAWNWLQGSYRTGGDGVFQICTRDLERNATVLVRVELPSQGIQAKFVETTRTLTANLTVVPVLVNVTGPAPKKP